MTGKGNDSLDWDLNGCLESGINRTMTYNWDNKLRSANAGDVVSIKYDPSGNRVWRQVLDGQTTTRKYILDSTGRLPVILLEIDADINDANEPVKTYIYAHSQILAQHDGKYDDNIYFYLHDRLGSVRQVIDTSANVKDNYTYQPFGDDFTSELEEQVTNNFKFTGQWYDSEISQYYLRARDYYPAIYRFTSRDPVKGKLWEPLTLHVYLYCANDSINAIDPTGQFSLPEIATTTGINASLYGLSAYFKGARGTALLMPIFKGAILGGGASFLKYGLQAKFLVRVVKGLESPAARGMITAGTRSFASEMFDCFTDEKHEFNLAESLANFGVAMLMGRTKSVIESKFLPSDLNYTFFGSGNLKEGLDVFYRAIRIGQSEQIEEFYDWYE